MIYFQLIMRKYYQKGIVSILLFFSVLNAFSQNRLTATTPLNNSILFSSTVHFSWNNFSDDSNKVIIASDSQFNNILYSSNNSASRFDTYTLPSSGKYYWKVIKVRSGAFLDSSATYSFSYSDIHGLSNNKLFFISDSGVFKNSSSQVFRWENLAKNTNSANQTNLAFAPIFIDSIAGLNNKPVVRLDGSNDVLFIDSSFFISELYSVFNWGNNTTFFNKSFAGLYTAQNFSNYIIGTGSSATNSLVTDYLTFSVNGKAGPNFSPINDYKLVHGYRTIPVNVPNLQIGKNRTVATYWKGDVAALIGFSAPQSDSIRNIIKKYICQKYSSTLSLGPDINVPYGFCDTLVKVNTNFNSYRWSNGDTTSSSFLSPGKTYQLTVTNNFGCSYTDEIYVTTLVKPNKSATLCLGDSLIWNTELSSSDYNFLWSNLTSDSALTINQPGDYYVRVTDTNNCFIEYDTITVSYDSLLANISLGPDTAICSGYEIGLQNPPVGIASYLWSTNQTIPRIVPQATGIYWLEVSANGCTERDSIFVTISGDAPTADFMANDACFGDSINFLDVSTNPALGTINQWSWNFGNTQNSVQQNPTLLYDSVKTYTVSLYIETDAQCSDSITKTITINPKPIAGFVNSLACKGDSIFFTDTSTILTGTIQSWRWKYNDLNQNPDTSRLQNPTAVFSTAQNYPIQLIIESDLGCMDTVIQNLKVNDLPLPNFTVSGNCLGDSTRFVNTTVVQQGTTLNTTTWRFGNNTTSNLVSPTVLYTIPNSYTVTLETEASDGCKASIQQPFEMNDKPNADFKTTPFYLNSQGKVTDLSTVTRTTLGSWKYKLNQLGGYIDSSSVQNPVFTLNSLNDFELTQTVTSLKGCKDTVSKVIMVQNNPKALSNLQSNITITKPSQGKIIFDSIIEFSWNKSKKQTPSTSYSLFISKDSSFMVGNTIQTGISQTNSNINISTTGKYFWKIIAFDLGQKIDSSRVYNFTYSDIYALSGLNLFFISDSGILKDVNQQVYRWKNLVDTTNNANQTSASLSPLFIDSIANLNNKPIIRLDGSNDVLFIDSSFVITEIYSIFNWGNNTVTFNKSFAGLYTAQNFSSYMIGTGSSATSALVSDFFTFNVNGKAGPNFLPLNDYKLVHGFRTNPVNVPNLQIGKNRTVPTHWKGDVASLIGFSAPLNDSLRNIVNNYLCQKYSNTLSLGDDINITYGFCDTLVQVDTNFTSYKWSNGDTTSASLLTPGSTYQLTVTNKLGCSYTDEIYVTTAAKPKEGVVLCLGETYIWNTELSNSDYNFLWSNLTTDSALTINQPGDYYVRITDTNYCFIDIDTITVSYDSTLAKITLGPDTSICLGYEIGLQNPPAGITSYLWSTNQTIPRIVPQTTGIYWLEVSANGCTERDSIFVTIRGDAPTADFIANDVCYGEIVNFIDVSTNPISGVINQWRWNFGNTQNSVQQNPTVLYDSVKTYTVSLYIETDAQCSDSITKTVTINPKPVAGFMNSLACKGDSIFFTDTSSVSAGTIQNWRWKYNDLNQNPDTSRLQNPAAVFSVAQNYPIQLIIESDLGCKDTVIQNLKVNDLPFPNYTVSGSCLGDSTRFVNSSVLPQGNTLKAISWRFGNNTASNKVNPTIFYPTPKFYLVTLETEASSGCKATIQRQFEMNDKPIADFKTTEFCLNNQGQVTDLSSVTRTTLSNWDYKLNQLGGYQDSSIVQNPKFTLQSLNDFELTQTVTSLKGCKDTASKVIMVRNNPKAFFNLQTNTGATPFVVKFDSISSSTNHAWSFGNGDSAFVYRPKYTYQDTGVYQIKLLLTNQFGCVDSMKRTVDVNVPNLNLFFDTIVVDQKNNLVRVGVVLINTGNNEINSVRMSANFNSNYRIEETWTGQLFPNDFVYTEFTSSVSLGSSGLNDFTCVEILAVNDFDDLNLIKDEICVKGTSPRLFLKGFPNPTERDMTIEMVVPNEGVVTAKVFDNLGREQFFLFDEVRSEGFYRFEVQSSILGSGVYYLIVEYKGASYKLPFIKK